MSTAINESRITIDAENYLKNLEAALLSPFYNAEISRETAFDLAGVFGDEEAKSNDHPLIPIVFCTWNNAKNAIAV
jgi:hypothetical protein